GEEKQREGQRHAWHDQTSNSSLVLNNSFNVLLSLPRDTRKHLSASLKTNVLLLPQPINHAVHEFSTGVSPCPTPPSSPSPPPPFRGKRTSMPRLAVRCFARSYSAIRRPA